MSDTNFLGQGLPLTTYDELAYRLIRKDWRDLEAELFTTKWFDYRFMHPTEATYLYASCYEGAYRRAFRANFDAARADEVRVFKKSNVFCDDRSVISGLWRGRQKADALGIPYDIFLSLAFKEVLRFWKQKHMPRPSHLYNDDLLARVIQGWEELQSARLIYATHDAYKLENARGLACQLEHVAWLKRQAFKRDNPTPILERFAGEGIYALETLEAA